MSKDVHTSHVLFYEMTVFTENQEILNLGQQGWLFQGHCPAGGPPWDGSVAKRVIWGKILLASREGSSAWLNSTLSHRKLAGGDACRDSPCPPSQGRVCTLASPHTVQQGSGGSVV